uniref:Uncharacterized protein n=1 Tax=Davidia involucrata TaxID=16924 RepID=A0A5B6ZKZ5_DAVIN
MTTPNTHVNESVDSPQSILITCHDTSPANNNLVLGGDSCNQGMEVESPMTDTLEHSQKLWAISGQSRKDRVGLREFKEQDISDEPAFDHKLSRHGALNQSTLYQLSFYFVILGFGIIDVQHFE